MIKKDEILKILNKVKLSQCGWEGREDIVTFNGKPIGGTITGHSREFDRWWPAFKICLAEFISNELGAASNNSRALEGKARGFF